MIIIILKFHNETKIISKSLLKYILCNHLFTPELYIYISKAMPISFFSLLIQLEYQRILFGSVIKTRKPKTRHFIISYESPILFLHFLNHGPITRKCLLRSLSTFITYKIATWVEHSYLKINGTSLGGGLCPNPDNLGA